jgi:hypothetical protein
MGPSYLKLRCGNVRSDAIRINCEIPRGKVVLSLSIPRSMERMRCRMFVWMRSKSCMVVAVPRQPGRLEADVDMQEEVAP